jgi:hypothetical protein
MIACLQQENRHLVNAARNAAHEIARGRLPPVVSGAEDVPRSFRLAALSKS